MHNFDTTIISTEKKIINLECNFTDHSKINGFGFNFADPTNNLDRPRLPCHFKNVEMIFTFLCNFFPGELY